MNKNEDIKTLNSIYYGIMDSIEAFLKEEWVNRTCIIAAVVISAFAINFNCEILRWIYLFFAGFIAISQALILLIKRIRLHYYQKNRK